MLLARANERLDPPDCVGVETRCGLVQEQGPGFATVLLAYVLIVSPLLARGDKALRFLQDEQKMYAWLKSNESQAPQLQSSTQQDGSQPVATVVNNAAQQYKLTVRRYEPVGENSVRVWFDAVPFNDLAKWMYQLENANQIRASQIDIEVAEGSGMVNARILLGG